MVWSIGFWTTTRTRTLNCNLQIVHGMLPQRDCFSLASINEEGFNLFDFVLSHVVLLAIRGTFPKTASNPVMIECFVKMQPVTQCDLIPGQPFSGDERAGTAILGGACKVDTS